jgi:hypothetical protein
MGLSDWYIDVGLDPQLDAVVYHSAPSSLSLASPTYENYFQAVCRRPECAKVKEGRVEFYYRHSVPIDLTGGICFRMKSNAPVYDFSDCFVVRDADDFWYVEWCDGLALNWLGEWAFETLHNTWRHMRVSWWEEGGTLRVRLEYEEGGVWNLADVDIDTGRNDNSGNAIQAVGLIVNCGNAGANKVWFDVVKIERLVSTI